jgi:hypothetical protein
MKENKKNCWGQLGTTWGNLAPQQAAYSSWKALLSMEGEKGVPETNLSLEV